VIHHGERSNKRAGSNCPTWPEGVVRCAGAQARHQRAPGQHDEQKAIKAVALRLVPGSSRRATVSEFGISHTIVAR